VACTFLNDALGDRVHLDLDVPVQDFIQQHSLRVHKAPGNDHCLLYAWAASTKVPVKQLKRQVLDEYSANAGHYQQAGIDIAELERYIRDRNYRLNSVDAILNILCNAYHVTAFVIGQKFDYSDQNNVIPVPGVMEIRRISGHQGQLVNPPVLLLKTGEHYDCIA